MKKKRKEERKTGRLVRLHMLFTAQGAPTEWSKRMLEARPCLAHSQYSSTPVSVRHRHSSCVLIPLACLAPIGCLVPAQALLTLTKVPRCAKSPQSCPTLCDPMDCSLWLLCLWNSPGKNARVGYPFLLQGVFLTQGLNPHL